MSEFKGTKGKWSYTYTGDQNSSNYNFKVIEICDYCDNSKIKNIGTLSVSNGRRIEFDSNAQLISKAPQMLQALKTTLEELRDIGALENHCYYLEQLIKEATTI